MASLLLHVYTCVYIYMYREREIERERYREIEIPMYIYIYVLFQASTLCKSLFASVTCSASRGEECPRPRDDQPREATLV